MITDFVTTLHDMYFSINTTIDEKFAIFRIIYNLTECNMNDYDNGYCNSVLWCFNHNTPLYPVD